DDSIATWRALGEMRGDEKRRLETARRIVAALREDKQAEQAARLLEECQRSLSTPALLAEAQLERAYLALDQNDLTGAQNALAKARKAGASEAALAEASFH